MKKIGKLSFEQFKKFAFTDMEFSEVACLVFVINKIAGLSKTPFKML